MNCKRCHHTDEAHSKNENSSSFMKAERCQIPTCTCKQYLDPIQEIDEDLL